MGALITGKIAEQGQALTLLSDSLQNQDDIYWSGPEWTKKSTILYMEKKIVLLT